MISFLGIMIILLSNNLSVSLAPATARALEESYNFYLTFPSQFEEPKIEFDLGFGYSASLKLINNIKILI